MQYFVECSRKCHLFFLLLFYTNMVNYAIMKSDDAKIKVLIGSMYTGSLLETGGSYDRKRSDNDN